MSEGRGSGREASRRSLSEGSLKPDDEETVVCPVLSIPDAPRSDSAHEKQNVLGRHVSRIFVPSTRHSRGVRGAQGPAQPQVPAHEPAGPADLQGLAHARRRVYNIPFSIIGVHLRMVTGLSPDV